MGAGAVDPCLYRADAGVECLGDFFVTEALLLEQEDGVALLVGEGGQCAVEGFFDLANAIGFFWLALHQVFAGVDVFERAAVFLAVAVNQSPPGEGEDEGVEGALGLVVGGRAIELDEGFLREVLGVGAVTGGTVEEVNQARLPAVDDLCEGSAVAFGQRTQASAVDIFNGVIGAG